MRQARKQLTSDPDAAYELVRNTLLRVRDHANLNETLRETLLKQLQNTLRDITLQGTQVKLKLAQQQLLDAERAKLQETGAQQYRGVGAAEARFRIFKNMMNAARFERYTEEKVLDGLREMQVEAMYKGQPVPTATQAAYSQVSANYNCKCRWSCGASVNWASWRSCWRWRNRTCPSRTNRRFTIRRWRPGKPSANCARRSTRSAVCRTTSRAARNRLAVSNMLEETIDMKDFQQPGGLSLKDALSLLYEKMAAKGKELPILIDTEAFKGDAEGPDVYETVVKFPPFPKRMQVQMVLRLALAKIRPDRAVRRRT